MGDYKNSKAVPSSSPDEPHHTTFGFRMVVLTIIDDDYDDGDAMVSEDE